MIRTPHALKIGFAAVVLLVLAGCDGCVKGGDIQRSLGSLDVVYPNPTDPNAKLSSQATENKATYDLGSVFMGQTATLPIQVTNAGNGPMTLSSIEVIQGEDIVSIGEVVKATRIPVFNVAFVPETSVDVAGIYDLNVTFQPEDLPDTVKNYDVVIKLRAANVVDQFSEVEIRLIGRGVSGVCNIPKELDFGAVQKGDVARETIPLANPTQLEASAFVGDVFGSDAQAFVYASDSAKGNVTLAPNTTKQVKLAFTPTDVRPYFAFAKMRASAQCPEVTVTLKGTGVDQVLAWYWVRPDNSKSTAFVDFGYASPGLEVRREVTFENFGKAAVTLSQLKYNSNEFKVIGEAGAMDPTKLVIPGAVGGVPGTKNLPVSVKPALLGPRQATLSWTSTLAKQPSGTFLGKAFGGGPDIQLSPATTLSFGKVAYFPTANPPSFTKRRITVQNVGTAPTPPDPAGNLHVTQIASTDIAPVAGTADTSEITATLVGQDPINGLVARVGENTAYVEVTVTPNSVGVKSWELTIRSNDPDEPALKVVVSADVQILPPCNYTVTPGNLNFGLVSPPGYRDLTFNVRNNGSSNCLINNLALQVGSDATFELPQGPIDSQELTLAGTPGDTLSVVVRAFPKAAVTSTVQTVTGNVEFFISSDTQPTRLVPLTAGIANGCLTIAPPDLNFGTVQRGCSSSERTVTLYNSCASTITVKSINVLDGAGFPNGQGGCTTTGGCPEFKKTTQTGGTLPITLAQGASPITFNTKYVPIDINPTTADQGTIAIVVTQGGTDVTYIVTMTGRGDAVGQNTDVFSQDAKPKADILIGIDSSCSMSSYQQALAQNFQSFIQYAQAAGVDYNLAIITTDDDGPPHSGRFVSGTSHPEKILTPNTANVEQKFAAKVNVGINGATTETCLAPMLKALTAPLINNENAGFLRPDAKLALVCVTDAPDQSTPAAVYYLSAFQAIKGSKAANSLTFNAIAGFASPAPAGCSGYDTGPDNGKYAYLVTNTNGVKDEICTPNWSTTLQQLGKTAFGFRTEFFLNSTPDLTGGKTIEVKIDGAVIPATDPRGATVWSYDSVAKSVNFEPSYVPEPGQTMTITYYVTCLPPGP